MKNQAKITFNKILPVSLQRSLFLEEALSAPCQHKLSSYLFLAFHRWQKALGLLWLASLLYGHYFSYLVSLAHRCCCDGF